MPAGDEAVVKLLKADIDSFCALVDKLEGFPKPPTSQEGGGKQISIDNGTPGSGWTLRYCIPIQHPGEVLGWAYVIDQKILDDSTDPQYTNNLTAGELVTLQADIATRVTLDSSWFPEV